MLTYRIRKSSPDAGSKTKVEYSNGGRWHLVVTKGDRKKAEFDGVAQAWKFVVEFENGIHRGNSQLLPREYKIVDMVNAEEPPDGAVARTDKAAQKRDANKAEKVKKTGSAYDVCRQIRSAMGRGDWQDEIRGDSEDTNERWGIRRRPIEDYAMDGVRYWGNWVDDEGDEGEEDNDFRVPTAGTWKRACEIRDRVAKANPQFDVYISAGEKDWFDIQVKRKDK